MPCDSARFLPTPIVPTPLSQPTVDLIIEFLGHNGITGELPLEVVSHREGRAIVNFFHENLDYTLKCFAVDDAENRAEFDREHRFYQYLSILQTGLTPAVLSADDDRQILLLSRIAGRRPRESEINRQAVDQAVSFLIALNQPAPEASPSVESSAAGACATISDHLNFTAQAVAELQQYTSEVNPQTAAYISDEISPLWQKLLRGLLEQFQMTGFSIDQPLSAENQILSPGELGFHNALLTPEKDFCFVDFDQSGKDDPARVLGRFFTQGPSPPKEDHWERVIEQLAALPQLDPHYAIRARLLLPVYQMTRVCLSLLRCLKADEHHSATQLITIMNQSRQWLYKANKACH